MNITEKFNCAQGPRRALGRLLGFLLLALPIGAIAETLMMPDREALTGQNVVVWGVTSTAAGNYTLDCGNGDSTTAAIADRSYIPKVCNYAAQGTYTAVLTVGGESDSAQVAVFNGAALSAADLRGVKINMAIEDGLRNLWTTQSNRAANFPAGVTTSWTDINSHPTTSLVVLAFENQGYTLPNNANPPTGLYEKYIVRRGLNFILQGLFNQVLTVTPQGDDPCVNVSDGPAPCNGFTVSYDPGYGLGVAMLPFAGSGALARINTEVAGITAGLSFAEILQRMTNTLAWGQADSNCGIQEGGWVYSLNSCAFDGSTVGWAILALLDARAAGITVPPWVATRFKIGFDNNLNNNGSFDYRADANPAADSSPGPQKVGIGLQGLHLIGELTGARVTSVTNNINSWWNGATGGIGGNSWGCSVPGVSYPNDTNKGCAYSMFNNFKGLKLFGIQTLPNVVRPAGPGAIPANDWHEDYKDWLLANQDNPTTTSGGSWGPAMGFSCCGNGPNIETAIAELLLSPVALVLPDPIEFGKIGLQHCLDGVPCTSRTPTVDGEPTQDTNPVGTQHTVVAIAKSINDDPIPGTTIEIDILSGPNAPQVFQGVSNASGEVKISYTSNGVVGTDELRASIGNLNSNTLTKVWEGQGGGGPEACDMDQNGKITRSDIRAITRIRGQEVDPAGGPGDYNSDGKVTSRDVKECNKLLGTVLPT